MSAANFYKKLGYQDIDKIETGVTKAGTETLFERILTQ